MVVKENSDRKRKETTKKKLFCESLYNQGNIPVQSHNRNTSKRCELCSKLTVKTPERREWRRCGVFLRNFKQVSFFVTFKPVQT